MFRAVQEKIFTLGKSESHSNENSAQKKKNCNRKQNNESINCVFVAVDREFYANLKITFYATFSSFSHSNFVYHKNIFSRPQSSDSIFNLLGMFFETFN